MNEWKMANEICLLQSFSILNVVRIVFSLSFRGLKLPMYLSFMHEELVSASRSLVGRADEGSLIGTGDEGRLLSSVLSYLYSGKSIILGLKPKAQLRFMSPNLPLTCNER